MKFGPILLDTADEGVRPGYEQQMQQDHTFSVQHQRRPVNEQLYPTYQ